MASVHTTGSPDYWEQERQNRASGPRYVPKFLPHLLIGVSCMLSVGCIKEGKRLKIIDTKTHLEFRESAVMPGCLEGVINAGISHSKSQELT